MYYCHRVATQLQLKIYHIIIPISTDPVNTSVLSYMQPAYPLYKLCCGILVDSTSFQLITGGYSNNNRPLRLNKPTVQDLRHTTRTVEFIRVSKLIYAE
jgi:hypothetical protein